MRKDSDQDRFGAILFILWHSPDHPPPPALLASLWVGFPISYFFRHVRNWAQSSHVLSNLFPSKLHPQPLLFLLIEGTLSTDLSSHFLVKPEKFSCGQQLGRQEAPSPNVKKAELELYHVYLSVCPSYLVSLKWGFLYSVKWYSMPYHTCYHQLVPTIGPRPHGARISFLFWELLVPLHLLNSWVPKITKQFQVFGARAANALPTPSHCYLEISSCDNLLQIFPRGSRIQTPVPSLLPVA